MIITIILASMAILVVFAAGGAIVLTVLACRRAWTGLRDSWRRARAVIEETEGEYRPAAPNQLDPDAIEALAATVLCVACRWDGGGTCTCAIRCKHPGCTAGFAPADLEFMRSLTMPEGTDQ